MTAHTGNRCGICGSERHASALHAHALADGVRLAQAGDAGGPLPPEPGRDACAARAGEPPGGKSAVGPDAAPLLTRLREKTLGCEGFEVGKENAEEISSGAAALVLSEFAPVSEAELRELCELCERAELYRAALLGGLAARGVEVRSRRGYIPEAPVTNEGCFEAAVGPLPAFRFAPVYGGGPINTSDVLTDEEDAAFGPGTAQTSGPCTVRSSASFVGAEIDMGPPVVLGAERITEEDLRQAQEAAPGLCRAAGRGLRRAIEGALAEEGGDLPLDVAIAVLVDSHTGDDAAIGFAFEVPARPGVDLASYEKAWRALRQHIGRRVDPGQYP